MLYNSVNILKIIELGIAYVAWPIIGGIIILSATGIVKTLFNW